MGLKTVDSLRTAWVSWCQGTSQCKPSILVTSKRNLKCLHRRGRQKNKKTQNIKVKKVLSESYMVQWIWVMGMKTCILVRNFPEKETAICILDMKDWSQDFDFSKLQEDTYIRSPNGLGGRGKECAHTDFKWLFVSNFFNIQAKARNLSDFSSTLSGLMWCDIVYRLGHFHGNHVMKVMMVV